MGTLRDVAARIDLNDTRVYMVSESVEEVTRELNDALEEKRAFVTFHSLSGDRELSFKAADAVSVTEAPDTTA
ncbi:MAG TPA: hypothetical protein VF715_06810 [Thermoleophilaceae bacterium]